MKKFKDPIEYALSKENIERSRKVTRDWLYQDRWFYAVLAAVFAACLIGLATESLWVPGAGVR